MFAAKDTLLTRPSGGYQISRSLRFNTADSAYLNRTPASATNRRTWTYSVWLKRGQLTASDDWRLLACRPSSGVYTLFSFINTGSGSFPNALQLVDNNGTSLATTPVYRDPSAWYHIVLAVDTTQATASNRVRIYVNGVEVTAFSASTYPTQNVDLQINTANSHNIGRDPSTGVSFFDGYQTEINLIDGTQLTPSSFGETNAQTGVWQPKAYSGSYGTNGFYLNFSDNSNTTAATLGKDYSGNGNNWTPNNFSVTAGAGNDSLVDSPTSYGTDTGAGGTVRGNYCTLNPLTTTTGTYSQGNLRYVGANQDKRPTGTISVSTGQWYWEVTLATAPYSPRGPSTLYNAFGFVLSTVFNSTTSPPVSTDALVLGDNGYYKNFSGAFTNGGVTFLSGDVLSVAVDLDANTFTFRVNNTSLATGTIGGTAGRELVPFIFSYNGDYGIMDCNFGQRPFAYTAPSGFKALCTQNLPTPTIGATTETQAGKFFNPVTYSGDGGTRSITGVGFQPDWVWIKSRSDAIDHALYDVNRGALKLLQSNLTSAEATYANSLTAFNTDGFSLGSATDVNANNKTYVAWNWKANGAGSSNTAGSITSTVSASTTSGFSVVTYTGTGANATVGHGLGVAPSMIISKSRSNALDWDVYHSALGPNYWLRLNSTIAAVNNSAMWRNVSPTSTVWSIGTDTENNTNGATYVAYVFAQIAGFSAFGSYTGNGSADGVFVYTGFRPAYVLNKSSSTSGNEWNIHDDARSPNNVASQTLFANTAGAEGGIEIDILSNGFKARDTSANVNGSGVTYIFAAFAETPFKFSLARQDSICTH